jgi:hypothetical protein
MSSIDDLIDEHGEENVRKAFWLQEHIKKEGIDGIHFMQKAEAEVMPYAHLLTYQAIRSELSKRF